MKPRHIPDDTKTLAKALDEGVINGLRLGSGGHVEGIVIEKDGSKKILRIVFEVKRSIFFWQRTLIITGAHFGIEDYW